MRPHRFDETKRAELFALLAAKGGSYKKAALHFKVAVSTIQLEVLRGGFVNPRAKPRKS